MSNDDRRDDQASEVDPDEFDDWAEEGWTEDEIDALIRDAVPEIDPDRYDAVLEQAITEAQRPEAPPQAQARARARAASGAAPTRSAGPSRWLMAAALVLVVGVVAVLATRPSDDTAGDRAGRPVTTTGGVQGPPSTAPSPCKLESGGGGVIPGDPALPAISPRSFRCEIGTTEPGPNAVVLFTDDELVRDVIPPTGSPSTPCVDFAAPPVGVAVIPAKCSGAGLQFASPVVGSFELRYRIVMCTVPDIPAGCGPPESDYVGLITVDVTG